MDWTLEVVCVPVTDVDRARAFYAERVGFAVDFDTTTDGGVRVVQLTPPGSGCSIAIGEGIVDMTPGSLEGLQLVVPDITTARAQLAERGVDVSEVQVHDRDGLRPARDGDAFDNVGFCHFRDPDGNRWGVQQISSRAAFDVRVDERFSAPPAAVFAAFTEPDQLARWYGPAGFSVPRDTVDVDLRVGGHQRWEMVSDDDPALRMPVHARICEVVPDRILMSTETWDQIPGVEGAWTVLRRLELQAVDGTGGPGTGTRVVLREGPHPEGHAELGRLAWAQMFTRLHALLDA